MTIGRSRTNNIAEVVWSPNRIDEAAGNRLYEQPKHVGRRPMSGVLASALSLVRDNTTRSGNEWAHDDLTVSATSMADTVSSGRSAEVRWPPAMPAWPHGQPHRA